MSLHSPNLVVRRFTGPVRDDSGSVVARLWTFHDRTDERRLERMRAFLHSATLLYDPAPKRVYEGITALVSEFYGSMTFLSIRDGDYMTFRAVAGLPRARRTRQETNLPIPIVSSVWSAESRSLSKTPGWTSVRESDLALFFGHDPLCGSASSFADRQDHRHVLYRQPSKRRAAGRRGPPLPEPDGDEGQQRVGARAAIVQISKKTSPRPRPNSSRAKSWRSRERSPPRSPTTSGTSSRRSR